MALSRLKQGFESPREHQSRCTEAKNPATAGFFAFQAQDRRSLPCQARSGEPRAARCTGRPARPGQARLQPSICSSSLPLVSLTRRSTKNTDSTAATV